MWFRAKVDGITSVELEQAICERQALAAPITHYWRHCIWLGSPLSKGFANKGGKGKIFARYLFPDPGRGAEVDLAAISAAQCAILALAKPVTRSSGRPQKILSARL